MTCTSIYSFSFEPGIRIPEQSGVKQHCWCFFLPHLALFSADYAGVLGELPLILQISSEDDITDTPDSVQRDRFSFQGFYFFFLMERSPGTLLWPEGSNKIQARFHLLPLLVMFSVLYLHWKCSKKEGIVHCNELKIILLLPTHIPTSLEIKNELYLIFQLSVRIIHGFCFVSTSSLGCVRDWEQDKNI